MLEKVEAYQARCDKCQQLFDDGDGHTFGLKEMFIDPYLYENKWQLVQIINDTYCICPDCQIDICNERGKELDIDWSEMEEDQIEKTVENYCMDLSRTKI